MRLVTLSQCGLCGATATRMAPVSCPTRAGRCRLARPPPATCFCAAARASTQRTTGAAPRAAGRAARATSGPPPCGPSARVRASRRTGSETEDPAVRVGRALDARGKKRVRAIFERAFSLCSLERKILDTPRRARARRAHVPTIYACSPLGNSLIDSQRVTLRGSVRQYAHRQYRRPRPHVRPASGRSAVRSRARTRVRLRARRERGAQLVVLRASRGARADAIRRAAPGLHARRAAASGSAAGGPLRLARDLLIICENRTQ